VADDDIDHITSALSMSRPHVTDHTWTRHLDDHTQRSVHAFHIPSAQPGSATACNDKQPFPIRLLRD